MPAIGVSLGVGFNPQSVGDTTPGGASDVWLWEDGIGLQWETGIFMLTE